LAVQLIKLELSATTATDVFPVANSYFGNTAQAYDTTDAITFPVSLFVDDTGTAATALQTVTTNNGFYQLFIEGQLQETGLYTVDADNGITLIATTAAKEIASGATVTLITTNFAPVSTTTISGTTISS
jgi:hypothetical protein